MRTARLITALAGLAILPVGAHGQERPAIEPGDRVRVTAPAVGLNSVEGTVAAIQSAQRLLRLETRDSVVVVPIDSMTSLDVRQSSGSKAAGLLGGAAAGALLGAAIGSGLGEDCPEPEGLEGLAPCVDRGDAALIGGILGAAVGAGIGYRITARTRWKAVPVHDLVLSVAPFRAGGATLTASIRF